MPLKEIKIALNEVKMPLKEIKIVLNEDKMPLKEIKIALNEDKMPLKEIEIALNEFKIALNESGKDLCKFSRASNTYEIILIKTMNAQAEKTLHLADNRGMDSSLPTRLFRPANGQHYLVPLLQIAGNFYGIGITEKSRRVE